MSGIDLLRIPLDRWFRRRDRLPKVTVRQLPGYGSSAQGCSINAGLVNDGGSIARGVVVRVMVDGELAGETASVDVRQDEPEKCVDVLVDASYCADPLPGVGRLPRGQLTIEAWHDGRRAAWCIGREKP